MRGHHRRRTSTTLTAPGRRHARCRALLFPDLSLLFMAGLGTAARTLSLEPAQKISYRGVMSPALRRPMQASPCRSSPADEQTVRKDALDRLQRYTLTWLARTTWDRQLIGRYTAVQARSPRGMHAVRPGSLKERRHRLRKTVVGSDRRMEPPRSWGHVNR